MIYSLVAIGENILKSSMFLVGFFYSLSIVVAFILGLRDGWKVALMTSIILIFNPMWLVWSNHIMLDIPLAAITTLFIYYSIKALENRIDWLWLSIAFLSFILASTIKPPFPLIFILLPIGLYSLQKLEKINNKFHNIIIRLSPFFLFLSFFILDAYLNFINKNISGTTSFDQIIHIISLSEIKPQGGIYKFLFESINGAYGVFISPYFYTPIISILATCARAHQ